MKPRLFKRRRTVVGNSQFLSWSAPLEVIMIRFRIRPSHLGVQPFCFAVLRCVSRTRVAGIYYRYVQHRCTLVNLTAFNFTAKHSTRHHIILSYITCIRTERRCMFSYWTFWRKEPIYDQSLSDDTK